MLEEMCPDEQWDSDDPNFKKTAQKCTHNGYPTS